MRNFKTKLGKDGGTVIPTEYRRELGVEPGDEIILHLDEEGLTLHTGPGRGAGAVTGETLRSREAKSIGRVNL